MLVQAFPVLGGKRLTKALHAFFRSPVYPILIAALMALSEMTAIELAVFYAYFVFGALSLLFEEDTLATLPIIACAYMTIAPENSTAFHGGNTIFDNNAFVAQLAILISAAVVLMAGRLVAFRMTHPAPVRPKLLYGFFALGAAYLLGGSFTPYYGWDTVLQGIVQIVSISIFYFYYLYSVNWEEHPKGYIPALVTAIGVGLLFEIAQMYTNPGVFLEDGDVFRDMLYTGWGVYNNIGCMLAMCIAAPCYFAVTAKNGWAYALLASIFLLGVALTQSRGAIIFGVLVYGLCGLWILLKSSAEELKFTLLIFIALGVGLLIFGLAFEEKLTKLFASLLDVKLYGNNRQDIYEHCWNAFLGHPFLGVGFYATPGFAHDSVGAFIPPRAHNTWLQLLSTGGVVAFAAYAFHRIETLRLVLCRPSAEKVFAALSVLALLLTSLLDCNFFNIGPGLLYGILLAFAECASRKKERPKKFLPVLSE